MCALLNILGGLKMTYVKGQGIKLSFAVVSAEDKSTDPDGDGGDRILKHLRCS